MGEANAQGQDAYTVIHETHLFLGQGLGEIVTQGCANMPT
jgi:hypothetical protein